MAHAFDIDTEARASSTSSTPHRPPSMRAGCPRASRRRASPRWSSPSRSRPRRVPTSSSRAARSSRGTRGGVCRWAGSRCRVPCRRGAHRQPQPCGSSATPIASRPAGESLGVEVYGGPLLSSWLDRDLGLAGRVAVRGERRGEGRHQVEARLFHDTTPLPQVAQLAIHLDREQNEGLTLNRQLHSSRSGGWVTPLATSAATSANRSGSPRPTSSAGTS